MFRDPEASSQTTSRRMLRSLRESERRAEGYIFRHIFGEDQTVIRVFGFTVTMYMVSKVLATLIVMVWNYFAKRAILTGKKSKKT